MFGKLGLFVVCWTLLKFVSSRFVRAKGGIIISPRQFYYQVFGFANKKCDKLS